ncbi:MAG TPA: SycD/LcrH family type III secretion system chaperone [Myxococcales bacterium]|nr:SycD/LcrH family type III secretion system chaperone [Myxococcales bacterium]
MRERELNEPPRRSDSRPAESPEGQQARLLQRWADGRATLKDVRGYSDEELYSIAKTAYFFYYQGRLQEARTLFQGLYAVNPVDPYFAKALGVVELAAGNSQGALSAYDVAIKLDPADPGAYVGRAEVRIAQGNRAQALEDLRKAMQAASADPRILGKARALFEALARSGRDRP